MQHMCGNTGSAGAGVATSDGRIRGHIATGHVGAEASYDEQAEETSRANVTMAETNGELEGERASCNRETTKI